MNEEKKFVAPLAEVVDFNNDDIITSSSLENFSDDPYKEIWGE